MFRRKGKTLILAALLLAGCAGEGILSSTQPARVFSAAPPRQFTEGETLYLRHCSACHGWEARGNGPMATILGLMPPSLRTERMRERYSEAELTARLLFGSTVAHSSDPATTNKTERDVSALIAYLKRLPSIDWEAAEMGREIYDSFCTYCHGVYGRGNGVLAAPQPQPPRDLAAPDFQEKIADEELLRIISDGNGAMPGTKDVLKSSEIRSVAAYIRVLSRGYELYERFCGRCHGSDGYPPAVGVNEIFGVPPLSIADLPRVSFDETYFRENPETSLRVWVRYWYRMKVSSMPAFGAELNGSEIRKIVEYLRSLGPEIRDGSQ